MSPHALSVAERVEEPQPQHSIVSTIIDGKVSAKNMLQGEGKVLGNNDGDGSDATTHSTHPLQLDKQAWTQDQLDTLRIMCLSAFQTFAEKKFPGKTITSCLEQALRLLSATTTNDSSAGRPKSIGALTPNLDQATVTKGFAKEYSWETIVTSSGLFRLLPNGKYWKFKVRGSKTKTKIGRKRPKKSRMILIANETQFIQDQTVSNGASSQNVSYKLGHFPRNTPQGYMYGQHLYPTEPSHPEYFSAERLWAMYSLLHIQFREARSQSFPTDLLAISIGAKAAVYPGGKGALERFDTTFVTLESFITVLHYSPYLRIYQRFFNFWDAIARIKEDAEIRFNHQVCEKLKVRLCKLTSALIDYDMMGYWDKTEFRNPGHIKRTLIGYNTASNYQPGSGGSTGNPYKYMGITWATHEGELDALGDKWPKQFLKNIMGMFKQKGMDVEVDRFLNVPF